MAGRYATALFDLARDAGTLEEVGADLTQLAGLLDASPDLTRLVRSPVFSAADQQRALAAVAEKAGMQPLTVNFLSLVAQNRRLFALREMIRAFEALLARHRGEVTAHVASAAELSEAQVGSLKAALKASLGTDIQVATSVDPGLLGGLVVKVGSRMVDTSLRTRLNNLKIAMKGAG